MKNLFVRTFAALALTIIAAVQTMAQDSFAYQAVIRDANGELITNKEVNLKFSLMQGNSTYYVETQKAKTNEYGNISVEIGKGTATQGAMADVPWSTFDIRMKVEVDAAGGNKFVTLGETKFLPVPYAMYAATSDAAIVSGATKAGENLFEVTDRDGNTVFAVTPNGIVVYVDDTKPNDGKSAAARSGFIVTGRTATKDGKPNDYFAVTADGTQVFIDDSNDGKSAAARSGFIITGRTATKSKSADSYEKSDRTADTDLFAIDGSLTTVYVDDNNDDKSAAARSGFLVTGRTAQKDGGHSIVDVNATSTDLTTSQFTLAEKAAEPVLDPTGEPSEPVQVKNILTITSGQVEVATEMTMIGDVAQKVEADVIEQGIEIEPIVVNDEQLFTEVTCNYLPNVTNYALLAIYDDGAYVPVQPTGDEYVLAFDESGNITKQHKKAAAIVVLRKEETGETTIVARALAAMHQTVEFGLMDATNANSEPYQFIKMKAEINADNGNPFVAQCDYGKINTIGDLFYGQNVTFVAVPDEGAAFVRWDDDESTEPQRSGYVGIAFETLSAKFIPTTYYVKRGGRSSNNGLSEKTALPTISDAIGRINGASAENDFLNADYTIKVVGTVKDPQYIAGDINASSITITGSKNGCGLDGNGNGPVLTVNSSTPVIISNLKITGGNASEGGGIYIHYTATVTLADGAIVGDNAQNVATSGSCGNKASNNGGGVYVDGGTLTLKSGSVVGYNYASKYGGGIYVATGGKLYIESGAKIVYNCGKEEAGGVWIENFATAEMTGGEISHNETEKFAGGIEIIGTFTMSGGTISYNKVTVFRNGYGHAGGGVYIGKTGVFNMQGTASIIGNYTAGSQGGAVKVASGTGTFNMTGGTIQGNTANPANSTNGSGNGIRVESSNFFIGGSAYIASDNVVQLTEIDNNNPGHPHKVNITSPLTNEIAATILPPSYENGLQVLNAAANTTYLQDYHGLFEIVPQKVTDNNKDYDVNWIIDENGCMQRSVQVKAYTTKDNLRTFNLTGSEPISNVEYEDGNSYFTYELDHWTVKTKENRFEPISTFTHDTTIYAIWNATKDCQGQQLRTDQLETIIESVTDSRCNYTINVFCPITPTFMVPFEIPTTVKALSLTLNGGKTNIKLPGTGDIAPALTVNTTAPVIIKNMSITGGSNSTGNGGGIYCGSGSNVTLDDGAIVGDNTEDVASSDSHVSIAANGGGVYVDGGTLTLKSGSVVGRNYATKYAGGIYVAAGSKLYIEPGAKIVYNCGKEEAGGIWVEEGAMVEMTGGEINNNAAEEYAGGVELLGTFTMSGGSISYNEVTTYTSGNAGGGAYIGATGVFNMSGTASIIGNHIVGNQGGAVKLGNGTSTFNMTGGIIQGNTADGGTNGSGNGIRVESSNFFIGDSALIASDNVVQLIGAHKVNIIRPLTNEIAATILPSSYTEGVQVLAIADTVTKTSVAAQYCHFDLQDNGYVVTYDGTIKQSTIIGGKIYAEYSISSAEEYAALFNSLNSCLKASTKRIYINVTQDLILENYAPLDAFSGLFDGNGHTFTFKQVNWRGEKGDRMDYGLVCGENYGIIQNAKLELYNDATLFPDGILCTDTHFTDCTGDDHPSRFFGICYTNKPSGIIRNCWNAISVKAEYYDNLGGICNTNDSGGLIENCVNTGDLTGYWSPTFCSTGNKYQWGEVYQTLGGIVGTNDGRVVNCVNYGTISLKTTLFNSRDLNGIPGAICGVLGQNGSVESCYWRENCVCSDPDDMENTENYNNNMVYYDSYNRTRKGSATSCGYFTSQTSQDGTITATLQPGTTTTCGGTSNQDLGNKTDLRVSLNAVVQVKNATYNLQGEGANVLKEWQADDNHAAVLKLKDN